jgi:hypothetical protein
MPPKVEIEQKFYQLASFGWLSHLSDNMNPRQPLPIREKSLNRLTPLIRALKLY